MMMATVHTVGDGVVLDMSLLLDMMMCPLEIMICLAMTTVMMMIMRMVTPMLTTAATAAMLTIRRLMVRGAPAIVRVVLMPFGDDNDDTQGDSDGDDDVHDIVEDVQLLTQIMMNRGDDGNIVAWTIVR